MSQLENVERFLAEFGVSRSIHEEHAKEHEVSSGSSGLGVMDLKCSFCAEFPNLDVKETGVNCEQYILRIS